jgi:hypothetical protein
MVLSDEGNLAIGHTETTYKLGVNGKTGINSNLEIGNILT